VEYPLYLFLRHKLDIQTPNQIGGGAPRSDPGQGEIQNQDAEQHHEILINSFDIYHILLPLGNYFLLEKANRSSLSILLLVVNNIVSLL
jgi:hypothetical protein